MKNKCLRSLILLLLAVLTAFAVGAAALADGEPWEGSGTPGDPWKIASPADLQVLAARVNGGESFFERCFILTQDLDLSGVCSEALGVSWDPIGHSGDITFYGVFDGAGHSVSGLYISGG
ncbi:MAG: hypothetical protein K5855_00875, partial [Oscillospiraceae bacterium]|nr:hypothetical protein [Oscillospiraceae bacterium]